jgi:hypothetical protein
MSARSTGITIVNGSGYGLVYAASSLQHGGWYGGNPGGTLNQHTVKHVADNHSDGAGAQGSLMYNVVDGGNIVGVINMGWDNPVVGSNSYSYSTTVPNGYICRRGGTGSGDNTVVTFVFCIAAQS